jgi:hypothetical protein
MLLEPHPVALRELWIIIEGMRAARRGGRNPLRPAYVSSLMHGCATLIVLLLVVQAAQAAPPDLQGTWDFGTKTPFQRPAELGDKRAYTETEAIELERKAREENRKMAAPVDLSKDAPVAGAQIGEEADVPSMDRRSDLTRVNGEYRTSIVIDPLNGQVPKRKEFADYFARIEARGVRQTDGPETLLTPTRCLNPFPVPSIFPMVWSALLQIVQTKDYVVLHTEMNHDARIVRLNGTHRNHGAKLWMGDSIGHYEGDTLVVHTIDFRPEQSWSAIMPMSADFELTERFTRASDDEIVYRFTVVDPEAYTRPFTGERTLQRASPGDRILEFACHEGNYAMTGILAGARKEEAAPAR